MTNLADPIIPEDCEFCGKQGDRTRETLTTPPRSVWVCYKCSGVIDEWFEGYQKQGGRE